MIAVQGLPRNPIEIRDRFECVRCGRRLHQENGAIVCDMPPANGQHTIRAEADIRRRSDVSRQTLERWEKDEADRMLNQGGHAMPIKDRKRRSIGLSRAGMIRLGVKVPMEGRTDKWGKQLYRPADVDYFVLKDAPAVAEAYAGFRATSDKYGSGPTELLVYLPFGDPLKNFDAWYELWQGQICHCRGDGEFVNRALDQRGIAYLVEDGWAIKDSDRPGFNFSKGQRVQCPGGHLDTWQWQQCEKCRLSGVMRVLVRDPNETTRLVGDELRYYQIRTHSGVTYDRLSHQMENYAGMAAQFGMALPGIPFRLLRIPETMSYVSNGSRSTADHALMSLEPDEEWVRVITAMSHKAALSIAAPSSVAALPAGEDIEYIIEDEDAPDGYDHDWVDEGEAEAEVVEDAPSATPAQNGNETKLTDITRPWGGKTVRRALQAKADKLGDESASDGQRGLMVGKLNELLGDSAKRTEFTQYVFDKKSSKDMEASQIKAVLAWMLDGEHYTEHAKAEAENVIRAAALERGQTDMFEESKPDTLDIAHDPRWANLITAIQNSLSEELVSFDLSPSGLIKAALDEPAVDLLPDQETHEQIKTLKEWLNLRQEQET